MLPGESTFPGRVWCELHRRSPTRDFANFKPPFRFFLPGHFDFFTRGGAISDRGWAPHFRTRLQPRLSSRGMPMGKWWFFAGSERGGIRLKMWYREYDPGGEPSIMIGEQPNLTYAVENMDKQHPIVFNLQFKRTDRARWGVALTCMLCCFFSFGSKLENCKAPPATRNVQRGRESDIPFNPLLVELLDRLRYIHETV